MSTTSRPLFSCCLPTQELRQSLVLRVCHLLAQHPTRIFPRNLKYVYTHWNDFIVIWDESGQKIACCEMKRLNGSHCELGALASEFSWSLLCLIEKFNNTAKERWFTHGFAVSVNDGSKSLEKMKRWLWEPTGFPSGFPEKRKFDNTGKEKLSFVWPIS